MILGVCAIRFLFLFVLLFLFLFWASQEMHHDPKTNLDYFVNTGAFPVWC